MRSLARVNVSVIIAIKLQLSIPRSLSNARVDLPGITLADHLVRQLQLRLFWINPLLRCRRELVLSRSMCHA